MAEIRPRPFHETIKEDILTASGKEFSQIASQLKRTIIPLGEIDGVIAAWEMGCKDLGLEDIDFGVPDALRKQKEMAQAQKEPVTLEELATETKRLDILLTQRHSEPRTHEWVSRLQEQIRKQYKLLSNLV